MEDYYKVLGVSENASQEDIRKKYRSLSLKYHPDKGGDDKKFKELNEAYQILGNKENRDKYDFKRNNKGNPFGGEHFSGIPPDIFQHIFGNQGFSSMNNNIHIFENGQGFKVHMSNMNTRPQTIVQTISITIQEAYTGCTKPLEIERYIHDDDDTRRIEKEKIYVDIPKGIDTDETITLQEKGNINKQGIKGDIKVLIKVQNDSELKRQGIDLIYIKKISLKESLCGFSFNLKHINGTQYKINNFNSVISYNYKKVVQGLGMNRGNKSGNLIISFNVVFPESISKEQVEKLKEIL
mgnify:CR=1 FL=1